MSPTRKLSSLALAALASLALPAAAQHGGLKLEPAKLEPAGLFTPPVSIGSAELVDPVDVAVMSWSHTPTTWVYAADAGANKVVRWVVTADGSAHVPLSWTDWLEGPWGIAVNDLPDHPQQEYVFVTGTDLSGVRCIQVYDKWGNDWPGNRFKGDPGQNFVDPRGIAVGPNGNVFVADVARRVVEEFEGDDVVNANSATVVNRYSLFTPASPFDVSVDLMRRVHVAANEFFPFPDGLIEVYRHGDVDPTWVINSANRIQGVDAKGPTETRYSWDAGSGIELHTRTWMETVWPTYSFSSPLVQDVPSSGAAAEKTGGLELQRSWRVVGLDAGNRIVQCDRRTYVSDRADDELQVMVSTQKSVPRPADAVAWWKLDQGNGTTAYETLNSRHGTWNAGGFRASEAMVRCGLSFDGGSFGVEVPSHPTLDVGLSDFTLEGWIRSEGGSGQQTFFDARDGSGLGYRAFLDNGAPALQIDDGGSSHTTLATQQVHDGLWHHVALVVERGVETRLFVDGAPAGSGASAGVSGSLTSSANLFLGRQGATSADGLSGGLDELTLYHRALSLSEIASIAKARDGGKHLPPLGPPVGLKAVQSLDLF